MSAHRWQVWVDTGGTFTDAVAADPAGERTRTKVLSTSRLRGTIAEALGDGRYRVEQRWGMPVDCVAGCAVATPGASGSLGRVKRFDPAGSVVELSDGGEPLRAGEMFEVVSPEPAPLLAARILTATPAGRPLPPIDMRLATTRGTNALLTRRIAPVALFVTRGFADLLEIGTQQRPDLFALDIRKPAPLHRGVVEVDERLDADGRALREPDMGALERDARGVLGAGIRSAAVALLHSDVNTEHERRVAAKLRELGFEDVAASSELAGMVKILPRAQTAVVEAALASIIREYLAPIRAGLSGGRLRVMTSAGGLVGAAGFRAKDSLLSGPAGGIVGAAAAARRSGIGEIVAFDMGGTSTDVSRWAGRIERVYEHTVENATLLSPAADVHTVAAGGGSLCAFDGGALVVGPGSAGADPGPACYGAGGPLTLTDVNLLAGRLSPRLFRVPLSTAAAERELEKVAESIRRATGDPADAGSILGGFLDVAAERIAGAVRAISTRRGVDPAGATLLAFGGAGGQHACAVADRLGISAVLVPRDAGVLSAVGLGAAVEERFADRQVLRPLEDIAAELPGMIAELDRAALAALREDAGEERAFSIVRRTAGVRLAGQESTLEIDADDPERLAELFAAEYRTVFGHEPPAGRAIELVWLRVAAATEDPPVETVAGQQWTRAARGVASQRMLAGGEWVEAPVLERNGLKPGDRVEGPALVVEEHAVTVVEPGWAGGLDGAGALLLLREASAGAASVAAGHGASRLELFTSRFESVARQMGEALRRTSVSVNVKERLDFSCALLDAGGELIACAPHVPVHLGSLGVCVRSVREAVAMEPGDVVVTNHPGFGGSHLPDVTVITPVHDGTSRLLGFVASRAHHAEIGGVRPGSMPPGATRLGEEGVVIAPRHAVRGGRSLLGEIGGALRSGPHPSRAVEDNLADIAAAIAANQRGLAALREVAAACGADELGRMMEAIKERSARAVRARLERFPAGPRVAEERLDDGSIIRVRIEVAPGGEATIDFTGTSGTHPANLNATPAIVRSAIVYVMRLLVDQPLPLNEGLTRPLRIVLPEGMLNPPFPREADPMALPAVSGGNVETSQRVVDTLLKALGVCAASQGTMNNVLFGNSSFSYYETVCGGAGAGPGFDGASAVHTHMTNTRITDPEILERRCPVRLDRFAVRSGSGGAGEHRGGDGIEREITFLAPASLSLLTQRRTQGPYGANGGGPGAPGEQHVIRADGAIEPLGPAAAVEVGPGDRLVLRTPGGGGWGEPG